ncbi:hypothetical protein PVK06_029753 [Gossypium arboreum]|uniref:Uncharacterized protein n=1 Tax=Gossypium arboreum TaxID=29729 RepID=A0ABR0NLN5_GOSAR|nr:hypothetical protein PVK06_029753 [Gossypium arboreum]
MGPYARVAHTPRLASPVWPTRPSPESTHPCRPTSLPCGPYSHTRTTTWLCAMHGYAFFYHTTVFSHTVYHTGDHTPMWHRQYGFSAFIDNHFSAFQESRYFPDLLLPKYKYQIKENSTRPKRITEAPSSEKLTTTYQTKRAQSEIP